MSKTRLRLSDPEMKSIELRVLADGNYDTFQTKDGFKCRANVKFMDGLKLIETTCTINVQGASDAYECLDMADELMASPLALISYELSPEGTWVLKPILNYSKEDTSEKVSAAERQARKANKPKQIIETEDEDAPF